MRSTSLSRETVALIATARAQDIQERSENDASGEELTLFPV
ncbi:MAG: hypothetical protein SWY16_21335 [Cyanobacteriota bacterium]|nr:hypothetical protein [Cyanobacteriota bacterium]